MLHIVNKSPFERNSLASCMKVIDDDSVILLIEDGVIAASKTNKNSLIADKVIQKKVFALKGDLSARGLNDKVIDGVILINYDGFVKLVVEHKTSVSWV